MNAMAGNYTTADGRKIGGVMMEMRDITLRFGGVTAIKDISFDIHEGEIRAIIGPNGDSSAARFQIACLIMPDCMCVRRPVMMLSNTVMPSNNAMFWNVRAIPCCATW